MIANVETGWKGIGSEADPRRPEILDDYPAITRCICLDGANPPDPTTVEIECDADTLAAIEVDPKYAGKVTPA